jgi:virginiamycin B lyase
MKWRKELGTKVTVRLRFKFKGKPIRSLILIVTGLALIFPALAVLPAHASPTITEYSVPTSSSRPTEVTTGPDGALWFTEESGNAIGRVTTSGDFTQYSLPNSDSAPYDIVTGPDGALWFTEQTGDRIGRITTSGSISEYHIPTDYATVSPEGITVGPDGNLWFTEASTGEIGQITTSGSITQYTIPWESNPIDIVTGPDGNLWFTDEGGNAIGRLTTSGDFTEYSLSEYESDPLSITVGPDGNLWFTQGPSRLIGSITTSGVISEHSYPLDYGSANYITTGPDGALWFTASGGPDGGYIGRITTSGLVEAYPSTATSSSPWGITTGPDGNLWFADQSGNIGTATVSLPTVPTNLTATSPTTNPPVLTWDASSEVNSYNVYRNGTNIGSTTSTTYTDGTSPQGTNSYYVTAVNSLGESADSNTVNVSYDTALPLLSYFTANNGSTFSRQTTPFTSGVSTQTVNSDGSVTVAVNDAPGYADSGFYLYDGPLSGLPDFTVNSSSGDFGLNLWFDNASLGDFFQWDGSGVMTGTGGDTYGLSSGSTGGTLAVDGSTSFYMMNDGNSYTLAQLQAGDDSAVSPSTNVAVWVGVDVGSGGSTSATISSIEGL